MVFDLDGTLIDSIGLIVHSYQHTFETMLGRRHDDEDEIRSWIGTPLLTVFERLVPGRAEEMYTIYNEWNIAHTEEYVHAYEGIHELLVALEAAGVPAGIATSKRRPAAHLGLSVAGLTEVVPLLVSADEVTEHKPKAAPLLLAVSKLGGDVSRSVYVGDSVVDLQAARNAGMASVAVTWGASPRALLAAEEPTFIVDTPSELTALAIG